VSESDGPRPPDRPPTCPEPHARGARRDHAADDTRRAILVAARQAFARDGYAATSLDAILSPTRLTKGALYHHFKNKAAVLEAVYLEMKGELAARIRAAAAATSSGAWDRTVAAIRELLAASAELDYRRIVANDAPSVLGSARAREIDHATGLAVIGELIGELVAASVIRPVEVEVAARVVLAAAAEVATMMAEPVDVVRLQGEGSALVLALLEGLQVGAAAVRDARCGAISVG
jgi:AcrR family transcriptional regulator